MAKKSKDKNVFMTKNIIDELLDYLNLKNYREFAEYLGIKATRVYSWVKYGKIADTGLVLVKNPEINPASLYDHSGPMLIDNQQQAAAPVEAVKPQAPRPEAEKPQEQQSEIKISSLVLMMVEVIETKTVYRPALISNIKAFHQAAIGGEENLDESDPPIREMMEKTAAVLESPTIYRAALLSNILAFHRAVEGEIEMGAVKDELAAIREQNTDIMARLGLIRHRSAA